MCQRAGAEERVNRNKEEWANLKSEGCMFIHKTQGIALEHEKNAVVKLKI